MNIGKVVGNIISTAKYPGFCGVKLLIIQPIDGDGKHVGEPLIGTDSIGAGNDEIVIYITSSEACIPYKSSVKYIPTDATIVGIVDNLYKEDVFNVSG
ncbi:MAG: ethanolamine utilization protein EutN [Candidatus Muiribacterium halophilum]|uniref:Ethanolamine utilization protein EutN n=1 Tax=Muiribacterium halophilum TaxID=2053465 RepID=A0A2N5ZBH2_MUIH1|nr:MAG: ethanolamine utilization protein EutN [Candidatus Muirbacterium halophilum]